MNELQTEEGIIVRRKSYKNQNGDKRFRRKNNNEKKSDKADNNNKNRDWIYPSCPYYKKSNHPQRKCWLRPNVECIISFGCIEHVIAVVIHD